MTALPEVVSPQEELKAVLFRNPSSQHCPRAEVSQPRVGECGRCQAVSLTEGLFDCAILFGEHPLALEQVTPDCGVRRFDAHADTLPEPHLRSPRRAARTGSPAAADPVADLARANRLLYRLVTMRLPSSWTLTQWQRGW